MKRVAWEVVGCVVLAVGVMLIGGCGANENAWPPIKPEDMGKVKAGMASPKSKPSWGRAMRHRVIRRRAWTRCSPRFRSSFERHPRPTPRTWLGVPAMRGWQHASRPTKRPGWSVRKRVAAVPHRPLRPGNKRPKFTSAIRIPIHLAVGNAGLWIPT